MEKSPPRERPSTSPEPMQVDRTRIFPGEHQQKSAITRGLRLKMHLDNLFIPQHICLEPITHFTVPVQLRVSANHTETLLFLVMKNLHAPIVLGHPWLTQYSPHIDWIKNTILDWSLSFLSSCLYCAAVD